MPKAGMSTVTAPSRTGRGAPSDSSSRSVSQAAEIPPASRTRAVVGRPLVSRSRTVTVASSAAASVSALVRPAASGFPRGFSAPRVTVAGSTDSPEPSSPDEAPGTAISSWL